MDRYERILTLHRILKSARYPVPLARLLDELQCSRATAYRDIAFLRDALGAPVDSDGDEAAFRYAAEEGERFELPGLWLNSEELQALLALNELVGRTGPGILATTLAPFRKRIDGLLSNQTNGKNFPLERIRVIGSGTRKVGEATFRHVASAVLGRRKLKFRYRARTTNETTQRSVSPQRLTLVAIAIRQHGPSGSFPPAGLRQMTLGLLERALLGFRFRPPVGAGKTGARIHARDRAMVDLAQPVRFDRDRPAGDFLLAPAVLDRSCHNFLHPYVSNLQPSYRSTGAPTRFPHSV